MPGILPLYDVNDKNLNDLTLSEFRQRAEQIDQYWRYFAGDHHKPLKVEAGRFDDNIIVNLCGRAVDKMTEFIGIPRRFELPGEGDDEADSPAQQLLDALLNEHVGDIPQIFVAGMVAGHVFIKINQADDGDSWRWDLIDARHIIVFWDSTNIRRKLYYRMQWDMGTEHRRIDIVPDWLFDETPTPRIPSFWRVLEYRLRTMSSAWELIAEDVWTYPFAPVVDWPNKRQPHQYYGISSLKNALRLNDAINFVASNTGRIIKYHAHPRTIATGMDAEDVQMTSIDGFFTIPSAEAQVFNLEMQSDLSSSLNYFTQLKGEFFADQRMVDLSTIRDKLGQVTNFGVRMIFNEQLENADEKRRVYGKNLAEIYKRLLIVKGLGIETPEVLWDDPLPSNRLEKVNTARTEVELGVSKQTIFEDIGRNYFKEQARIRDEGSEANDILINALERFGNSGGAMSLFGGRAAEVRRALA